MITDSQLTDEAAQTALNPEPADNTLPPAEPPADAAQPETPLPAEEPPHEAAREPQPEPPTEPQPQEAAPQPEQAEPLPAPQQADTLDPQPTPIESPDAQPQDDAPSAEPPPAELRTEGRKRDYWKKVLTGDPATVPAAVRRKAGAEAWDSPEDQRQYRMLAAINKSWAADHLPVTREQISTAWPRKRAELARQLHVQDNEHELFLALSEEHKDAPRKEAARELYNKAYLAGLEGKDVLNISAWEKRLPAEDWGSIMELADMAYIHGRQKRDEVGQLAKRLAKGLDFFAAVEEDAISAPRVISAGPDLLKAIDELADLDEQQQNIALYLAAGLVKESAKGKDVPGLLVRSLQSARRGSSNIGFGLMQAVANVGIASMNNLSKRLESESLHSAADGLDKRMRMFHKLQKLSQQELRPLVLPEESHKAASYLITAAESVPAALLAYSGGRGFSVLTMGAVGESVAEARSRAPLADQELQLYAGLLGGAIQAGIFMNLNRVGGRLLEQSLSRIGRASGQGIAGYTLAGLNVMGSTTVEAAKMLTAGKLAQATDLGAQEMAARLSQTASNIDWRAFGNNLTDVEANMQESASLLPILLLGSGRLALHHFRSPRAILGEGKMLSDWGIPEQKQEIIMAEKNLDAQSNMLREAICSTELWSGIPHIPSIWRALRLLHSDSFREFSKPEQVHDFLRLPSPEQEPLPPLTQKKKRQLPYNPDEPGLKERRVQAINLWNEWWQRARINRVPAPYPNANIFAESSKQPAEMSMRVYDALLKLDSQVPRRMRELSIYAPHAEAERAIMFKDRINHLQELSYQFLMSLHSVDQLERTPLSPAGLRSTTERSRKSLLGAVVRAIMNTARGVDRVHSIHELNTYLADFYVRRKNKGITPQWIDNTQNFTLSHIGENARAYFLTEPELTPEMMNVYRMIWGLHASTDALIDLLPHTQDFQTALSRGLSPEGAYANILGRELGLTRKDMETKSFRLGAEIENTTPMLQYTWENAEKFKVYSQLTGTSIEHAKGENAEPFSRTRRPNGTLTHWHAQDGHVMNDVAGNAALFFLPFGGYHGDITRVYTEEMQPRKGATTLNLLNRPTAEHVGYTAYDQLCNLARHELSRVWLENLPDVQPGLHLARMRRYLRKRELHDATAPLLKRHPEMAGRFKVDDITQATPLAMAQGRFLVYWERMLHSGFISPQELGNFLVERQAITPTELEKLLNPPIPVERRRRSKDKLNLFNAEQIRRNRITAGIAEKMADYTTLRFLAGLHTMPLPNSVKEWVGMAAFCPEGFSPDATTRNGALSLRDRGLNLTNWANRSAAQKLRELAPQVEKMRTELRNAPAKKSLIDSLLADATGMDPMLRYERSWCYDASDINTMLGLPQQHWNMLRYPRRTWERMSEEERAPYRERLTALCEREPAFISPEIPAKDPVEAAIFMLDDFLREYPQMHRFSMEGRRLDRIRYITLYGRDNAPSPEREPYYKPIPVYQWNNKMRKGYKVISTSTYLPEFFTSENRAELALSILDELRSFSINLPHSFRDGIWWKGDLYGLGGKSPLPPDKFHGLRPLEPLVGTLQSIYRREKQLGPISVGDMQLHGLDPELNLRPLQAITIYRAGDNSHMVYRLMPGDANLGSNPMGLPYLVHNRNGVYMGSKVAIRSADEMDQVYVPLHRFHIQPIRYYKDAANKWKSTTRQYTLDKVLQLCAEAASPADEIAHYNEMLEYLMRITEDNGFSLSLAGRNPGELELAEARLLNLAGDMLASLCSNSPEPIYARLAAQAEKISNSPELYNSLLNLLEPENIHQFPSNTSVGILAEDDIFADEIDRAVHEKEAELEAEEVGLQNEQPDEDNLNHGGRKTEDG